VPPGFTITTKACNHFFAHDTEWPATLPQEMKAALAQLEARTGKGFGDDQNPLLVSVRSGAPVSMPGMMDTVLNLGLNDTTVEALATRSGNPRFAYDSYRRFISMFGDVVLGIHYSRFARVLDAVGKGKDASALTLEELKQAVRALKEVIVEGHDSFPEDPDEQLHLAVNAVFSSFNTPRARYYRKSQGIPNDTGVLYPRPQERPQGVLWRVVTERPRRRCGGWNPHATAAQRRSAVEWLRR
jgi:pyruvate,orthophosphate dikinase